MRCNHLLHLGLLRGSLSNFDILFHATYMRSHHPTTSLLQSAKASTVPWLILRTTVPLVSYIRNSFRFWYYASLSTCCQNLEKKMGSPGKFWEKAEVKLLRDLTEKSVNVSTLATSNIRFLLFLVKKINKRN